MKNYYPVTKSRLTLKSLAIVALLNPLFCSCLVYGDVNVSSSSSPASNIPDNNEGSAGVLEEPINDNQSIKVTNKISDRAIKERIQNILAASDWFEGLRINSSEGVVVLSGSTAEEEHKEWAGKVAGRTEGVVAVINKISLVVDNESNWAPVLKESQLLWRNTLKVLPSVGISCIVLLLFFMLAKYLAALTYRLTRNKVPSIMLRRLIANAALVPVMLVGIYLVLRITGLSKMATTILGGTGLVGLVLGFALRDIAENFFASVLISIQRPFRLGETIQVLTYTGVVQAVTTRGTVIMTLEGNHVQIPNTIIYKEAIVNLSANPNMRLDFVVGIGYDASISDAQNIALQVLIDHPAVLKSPEPWVLAEALTASTVNMRIYFWVNSHIHNALKVKSAVIRNIKYAFLDKNISMPDDAREVIFPQGIHIVNEGAASVSVAVDEPKKIPRQTSNAQKRGDDSESTKAEGNLDTDVPVIKSQAKQYSLEDGDTNLLADTKG